MAKKQSIRVDIVDIVEPAAPLTPQEQRQQAIDAAPKYVEPRGQRKGVPRVDAHGAPDVSSSWPRDPA